MYRNTSLYRLLASCRFGFVILVLAATPHSAIAYGSAALRPLNGIPIPDVAFIDRTEREYSFRNFKNNKLIALHFWATWCKPCIAELPDVNEAQERYGAQGFKVLAISVDQGNIQKVINFMNTQRLYALTPYLDRYMQSYSNLEGRGLPTTIFVDSKGKMLARAEGPLDWESSSVKNFIEDQLR